MKLKWMTISLLASISSQTYATLIYDDSNTHQINGSMFQYMHLENGCDLYIVQGRSIQTTTTQPTILRSDAGVGSSTIILSGNASATGGIQQQRWSHDEDAVVTHCDTQVLGQRTKASGYGRGAVSGARYAEINGNGASAIDNTTSGVQIVSTHDVVTCGGDGVNMSSHGMKSLSTVSGTISRGSISGGNGATGGSAIYSQGGTSLDISGGSFQGGSIPWR
jgi:hypothetical protein